MGMLSTWLEKMAVTGALGRLIPLELGLLAAYDRAIGHVGVPGTADQLAQFRNEHAKHLEELIAGVEAAARLVPQEVRDSLRTRHGGWEGALATDRTEEALGEVLAAERKVSEAWGRIRMKPGREISGLISRFRDDEDRHLRFLETLIRTRVWEQAENPDLAG